MSTPAPTPAPDPVSRGAMPASASTILAIAVGNTRTRVGAIRGGECVKAQSLRTDDPASVAAFAHELFDEFDFPGEEPVILVSTVSHKAADAVEEALRSRFNWVAHRFGRDLQIPVRHALTDSGAKTVGQDRLLCAIGAFSVVRQACIVIDMGTAITVDFVDGDGVFHGGAIMPGVSMMLDALHARTAHLPQLAYEKIDPRSSEPGRQTDQAMLLGVSACVRGGIRYLAERYAMFYEGYPQIIATGGDMGVLEDDELIESFVPDLQLKGIQAACAMVLESDADVDDAEHDTRER